MTSSLSLLCLVFLHLSLSRASPSAVSTETIVTTITSTSVSDSLSTSQTVFDSSSTYENIQTITTTDSNANTITTTTDLGPVTTVVQITSDVVATIQVTQYVTFQSTVGESTIYGAAATSNAPPSSTSAAASVSPAPAGSTETSTYVSLGITYAPVTAGHSSKTASTIMSIASPSTSAYNVSPGFPSSAPASAETSGMSTGAKAAVGTAAVVVSIFLAILVFWLDRLRRQRKAIAQQYPDGQASGDEAGIFGFFSPIVGKPYEKEENDAVGEKAGKTTEMPATMVRELSNSDITPPAMEISRQPYRRPIPQRNPHSPHSPISPISPVRDSMPEIAYPLAQADVPDSPNGESSEPFRKGFPIRRFPSHHATKSSGNVTALPDFFENG